MRESGWEASGLQNGAALPPFLFSFRALRAALLSLEDLGLGGVVLGSWTLAFLDTLSLVFSTLTLTFSFFEGILSAAKRKE